MLVRGISQYFKLANKVKDIDLKFEKEEFLNNNFDLLKDNSKLLPVNINLWHISNNAKNEVKFNIENETYRKYLKNLKSTLEVYWNDLDIQEITDGFILTSNKLNFKQLAESNNIDADNLICLKNRLTKTVDNTTYTLLINQYLYFVLSSKQINEEEFEDDIYDWGIVDLPKFMYRNNPIFNVTIPNTNLVYGVSTNYCI